MAASDKRTAIVFPDKKQVLQVPGKNLMLARKRRKLTQTRIADTKA